MVLLQAARAAAASYVRAAGWTQKLRSPRQVGQSIVEFGLVVMLFVLLISAIFDFGVMLNARLSLSSISRVLARAAAENANEGELLALAKQQDTIIGVTTDTYSPYLGFSDINPNAAIVLRRTYYSQTTGLPISDLKQVAPGDQVQILVKAQGMEVLTPLARPIFGCNDGTQKHCYVPLTAETTMRVEFTYPTPTPG